MRRLHRPVLGILSTWLLLGASVVWATEPTRTRELRLLTWNVGTCNPLRFRLPESSVPRVIETIAAQRADVVFLQEVCNNTQASQLARALGFRYASVAVDPRRSDGRRAVTLYRGDGHVLTHRTANGFGVIALEQGGVTVVNVHAPIDADDRSAFFPDVADWAHRLGGPVVVAGDYNLGPEGGAGLSYLLPWQKTTDRASFAELVRRLPVGTRPEMTNMFRLAIDHVRMTEGRVVRQEVLRGRRIFPMDHDALVADLRFELRTVPASEGFTHELEAVLSTSRE